MDLHNYRKQIDEIDDELLRLFIDRMSVARQIALYKKEHNLPALDAAREKEKLLCIGEKAGEALCSYACTLYTTIFEISRTYQKEIIT